MLSVLGIPYYAAVIAAQYIGTRATGAVAAAVNVLRWSPGGMLGRALADVRAGYYLQTLAETAAGMVTVALVCVWWARSLNRALTTAGTNGPRAGANGPGHDIVTGRPVAKTLAGKNLALAILLVPVVAVLGVVLALIANAWALLPSALLMALAALTTRLGCA